MVGYPIGDFLIRLKNAARARNKSFWAKNNSGIFAVAKALQKLGFVDEIKKEKGGLTLTLSFKDKKPKLMDLKLVSKPGLRIYMKAADIEKEKGPSTYLVSTPKGILSSKEAIKQRAGGEVIAKLI